MKRVPKPVFFVVALLILAFSFTAILVFPTTPAITKQQY